MAEPTVTARKRIRPLFEVQCANCGKKFLKPREDIRRWKTGRCFDCSRRVKKDRRKCATCGGPMNNWYAKRCGKCHRADIAGEKNPNWRGGINMPPCTKCGRRCSAKINANGNHVTLCRACYVGAARLATANFTEDLEGVTTQDDNSPRFRK